ncbi:unnamed protein product [Didymodactylos carnosus]|uniref:V-SNARE coiled-coil homology domain-containing protein n=1 Tax=Didymodactylos carnosus TaxID=1234261 RepID=A0A815CA97_9BILA|nr:unnamed protein product [Didymodactylos carnosus]CAF1592725.1 unnamed protein product [Didymodactylos carnosus]CAF4075003.1 unnamed protein product [Didymodactylos carnosus]CAF4397377.1 unnamed protein product [Didymodactylos carnosus]
MDNSRASQYTTMRSQLDYVHNDVNQVVEIMKDNIIKVIERDDKLTQMDSKAKILSEDGMQFETTTKSVLRQKWWKNVKIWIILIILLLIIIIIVVTVTVTLTYQQKNDNGTG